MASVLRRPSLMVPHVTVPTVSDLNYEALKKQDIVDAIVFDKDNTLTAPYENKVHPQASCGLEMARCVFGNDRVAILSNSVGSSDDIGYRDAKRVEDDLGIAVIRHQEKKPGGLHEVLHHFSLSDATRICVVGDRILTDIVFGNLHGMFTVHTQKPLQLRRDHWTARMIRPVENVILYGRGGRRSWLFRKNIPDHVYWTEKDPSKLILLAGGGDVTQDKKK
eukprot:CAMPEP_0116862028 /NCGR_PEP_ID=MMETSP0418-20121206/23397_1 /TAXON_ID=1158023 /ORGANISM="Astrosyne radiata, Strain 13vi08-1A" /LENGTH=220 /DNA_ID=CAMNT_0004496809 /DNA_START=320 /DNA_END=982 /DNA_ORIENTATION=+